MKIKTDTHTRSHSLFAQSLARVAGGMIRDQFSLGIQKHWKDDDSPVTKTDIAINKLVIDKIASQFPTHSVLAEEESSLQANAEYVWVCDPIDGTIPFSHGIPTCVFSLALVKDGIPIVAVVYDPFLDRMFTAEKGHGAKLNNNPIRVSESTDFSRTLIGGNLWKRGVYNLNPVMIALDEKVSMAMISVNSVIYEGVLVASGQIGATFYASKYAHDVATLKLIVEEAGGKVTDLFGNDQRYDKQVRGAVISNGLIHDELVALTKKALL